MNMGGKSGALLFWMQYLTLHGATRISQVMENWVLALWSGKYEFDSDTNVPAARYVPDTPPSLSTKKPWPRQISVILYIRYMFDSPAECPHNNFIRIRGNQSIPADPYASHELCSGKYIEVWHSFSSSR